MLALLPFIVLILVFVTISFFERSKKLLLRERVISSLVIWSILFVVITELLSVFNLITFRAIAFSWGILSVLLIFASIKNLPKVKSILPRSNHIKMAKGISFIPLSLALIFAILIITFILAISVAPNNIDAASYHLARVMHWIQNRNIYFYPTNIQIQAFLGVFASYVQLHFYLLSGGDRFSNVIQWIFSVGTLAGISLLAKNFGADLKEQVVVTFIGATIPMGILQASTTHDPYIIAFFLVSFIYFSLKFLDSKSYFYLFLSSLSLGLAWFTKQTAYVYAFPFMLWIFWMNIKKFGTKEGIYNLALLSVIAVLINVLFYFRNFQFAGLPLFSIDEGYINEPIAVQSFIANMVKNIAHHSSTPFLDLNHEIHKAITMILHVFNISENSPGLNWKNQVFGIPPYLANENIAPNTIHLLLFVTSIPFLFKQKKNLIFGYFWSIIAAFSLFSGIFRWQTPGSHLELTLFVLSSVIIGKSVINRGKLVKYSLLTLLTINSFYFLFFNLYKPLITARPVFWMNREEQLFISRPELYQPYKNIATYIKSGGYKNVGVIFVELRSDFEYPLWVLLKEANKNIRIEHVDVKNSTDRFSKNFKPDIVVFLGTDKGALKKYLDSKVPIVGLN